jgi:hypothetical protein
MLTNCMNRIATLFCLALMLLALTWVSTTGRSQTNPPVSTISASPPSHAPLPDQSNAERIKQRWILSTLIVVLLGIGAAYHVRKPQNAAAK